MNKEDLIEKKLRLEVESLNSIINPMNEINVETAKGSIKIIIICPLHIQKENHHVYDISYEDIGPKYFNHFPTKKNFDTAFLALEHGYLSLLNECNKKLIKIVSVDLIGECLIAIEDVDTMVKNSSMDVVVKLSGTKL